MVLPTPAPLALPEAVWLEAWIDPVVETLGFGPRSDYVEACWLPLLGPTATWTYRRLGTLVLANNGPAQVDLVDLARSLGLGAGLGTGSKLARALMRLARFEVVRGRGSDLSVRRALPPLTLAQQRHLSPSAQAQHWRLTAGHQRPT